MGRPKGSRNKAKDGAAPAFEPGPGTALARVSNRDVVTFLNDRKKVLEGYAIREYRINEFMRGAQIAITENTRLRNALKTRAGQVSLYNALRYAAATGLSLNPQQGKAALVPYHNQGGDLVVNYQIMKSGLIDLVMETGQVKDIVADLVRENDEFSMERTAANDSYNFRPKRRDRGSIDGYFAAVTLKTGRTHVAYMSIEEVHDHRDRYNSSKKLGERSPWFHSEEGMSIKTVIKKLLRNLHLSPATGAAVSIDDESETGMDLIEIEAEPIPASKPEPEPTAAQPSEPEPKPEPEPASEPEDPKGTSPEDLESELAESGDDEGEVNEEDTAADDSAI